MIRCGPCCVLGLYANVWVYITNTEICRLLTYRNLTFSYSILPYPNLPCPTLPYLALPYLILSYPTLPYTTLPRPPLLCHTLSYPTLTYPTLPYPTLTYPILPCPILSYSILPHSISAPKEGGGTAWLQAPSKAKLKKKNKFRWNYAIIGVTWFKLQLKSPTEIRWWLVHWNIEKCNKDLGIRWFLYQFSFSL